MQRNGLQMWEIDLFKRKFRSNISNQLASTKMKIIASNTISHKSQVFSKNKHFFMRYRN